MIKILSYGEVPNSEIFARDNISPDIEGVVAQIIADVIRDGDKALYYYLRKFDKAELDSLEVSTEELDAAFEQVEPEFIEVLKKAAGNIRRFHEKQVRNSFIINDIDGVLMGQKIMPIEKVGLYVPGRHGGLPFDRAYGQHTRQDSGLFRDCYGHPAKQGWQGSPRDTCSRADCRS